MPYIDGDVRLHYRDWGRPGGQPVLLIHGIQGCAAIWAEVAEGLAGRGFRVVAYDLRGHGRSGRSDDYQMAAHVRDAAAVIEQLGLAPVAVVGHSLGGSIAWEAAADRPDLVARLVIEDQHPDADAEAWRGWQEWADAWPRRFGSREGGLGYLREHGRSVAWWGPSLVPLPAGGWGWAFDIPGVVAMIRLKTESWGSLARVMQPTLLLRGERSTHLTAAVAERMVRTLPYGRALVVPGADHWIHRDAAAYVAIVAPFLKE
ncbi:MAG: ydjP [Firmicutes bacterium]|nr:ydjP [Bacillota bacterium]